MFVLYALFTLAFAVAALQYLYQRLSSFAALRYAIQKHGCQRAPQYPHRDIWGYDLVQDRIEASKRGAGYQIFQQHFSKYGKTFEEHFGKQKTITTMEPANYQHVLGVAAKDFVRLEPKSKRKLVKRILGPGILSSINAEWKHQRVLITPIFARGELADINTIGKHVDRLIKVIPRDRSTIDAKSLLQKMFLDVASEFLLGESLNSLNEAERSAETDAFLETWEQAMSGIADWRSAPRYWFLRSIFPNDFDRACQRLHQMLDRHVYRALRETSSFSSAPSSSEKSKAELSPENGPPQRYIFINEAAKKIRDPTKLRAEVANIFFVARDNVAMCTANALFQLARHPEIWTDLRRTSVGLGDEPLTFDLLRSRPLSLFRYVYNETLRMQGPAIHSVRKAVNNSILPTGGGSDGKAPVFVEKGTMLYCDNWSMHHDPLIWGPDAEDFRPSRWENRKPPMWEFVPFGGGPRICPALQQVYTHFVFVMVKLTREFETIENRDPTFEYLTQTKLTVESRNGVKIALIPPPAMAVEAATS
ncbi:MAG: hypothetical protein Q9160_000598 [Pyrenula sp. 1 TL-2023]